MKLILLPVGRTLVKYPLAIHYKRVDLSSPGFVCDIYNSITSEYNRDGNIGMNYMMSSRRKLMVLILKHVSFYARTRYQELLEKE
jgi:hypothetical protein